MTSIFVIANGSTIKATADGKITSGMVGLPIEISYNESWNGLYKTAFFKVGEFVRKVYPVDNSVIVPWEVLRKPGGCLEIGLEGKNADGSIVIPTIWATAGTIFQGAAGSIPAAPNPDSDSAGGGGYIGGDLDMGGNDIVNAGHIYTGGINIQDASGTNGAMINPDAYDGGYAVLLFEGVHGDKITILRHIAPGKQDDDAVTVAQLNEKVDAIVSEVSTALDEIHAYAQQLVGGV